MEKDELTIKEVAALTGLSGHTLRYYERVGLLGPIGRTQNGHRRYSEQDIAWIEFLDRLRSTGMPIRKMQRFAELRRGGEATVPERRTLLEGHRSEVRERVAKLERDLAAIDEKVELYAEMEANSDAATETNGAEDPLRSGDI